MAQQKKSNGNGNGNGKAQEAPVLPQIKWDDSQMESSYANVCNVSGTREELMLFFGLNQTWAKGTDFHVKLNQRIVMSPFAAKRLNELLTNVLSEYEKRHGSLKLEQPTNLSAAAPSSAPANC